jgi:hypothetical protein
VAEARPELRRSHGIQQVSHGDGHYGAGEQGRHDDKRQQNATAEPKADPAPWQIGFESDFAIMVLAPPRRSGVMTEMEG